MNRQELIGKLAKDGVVIDELPNLESQPFSTYYKPNGEAMRLPADPYSLKRYLRRGFTLVPPPRKGNKSKKEG